MLSNIGISGLVLIVIMAIVVFGPKKLPEIGRSFGKSLKEFRDATSGRPDAPSQDASANVQAFTQVPVQPSEVVETSGANRSTEVEPTTQHQ